MGNSGSFKKGHIVSEETKKRMSLSRIGKKYCLGNKLSAEHKEKIGLKLMGHTVSIETREKIRLRLLGNKNGSGHSMTPAHRQKISEYMKNRIVTDAVKEKIRISLTGRKIPIEVRKKLGQKGDKNYFWKGGVSLKNKSEREIEMHLLKYKLWRESVFSRDNWTCVQCGIRGAELNADHIKSWAEFPLLRYELTNGRTLCVHCHRRTDSYGNRNKIYGLQSRQRSPA